MRSIAYAGHDFSELCSAEVVGRSVNSLVAEAMEVPGRAGALPVSSRVAPSEVTVRLFLDLGLKADTDALAEARHKLAFWLCVPGGGELVLLSRNGWTGGTVFEKYVESGEFVTTGKPLLKVADTHHMFIRAYITSAQLKSIKVGQKVKVFADYGDRQKKEYAGTVSWISSRSEFTPKTILTDDERADLVYAVKIAIRNDGYAKIGMYGEVKF